VRPVVVAVDVAADPTSRVVEGLVLVEPYLPFFEFPEPGSMNAWLSGSR
jgi:hypothetical protein